VAKPVVLVADDDAEICALVRAQLERAGMDVLTAGDGEEALRLARQHRPRAAVLDVMMPKLNGYQVAERLREDEATRGIGILLLTARAGGRDETYGYEVGADDYVRKPFKGDELRARLRAVLDRG
jgi:DNA-binding response OmpR family regulator